MKASRQECCRMSRWDTVAAAASSERQSLQPLSPPSACWDMQHALGNRVFQKNSGHEHIGGFSHLLIYLIPLKCRHPRGGSSRRGSMKVACKFHPASWCKEAQKTGTVEQEVKSPSRPSLHALRWRTTIAAQLLQLRTGSNGRKVGTWTDPRSAS